MPTKLVHPSTSFGGGMREQILNATDAADLEAKLVLLTPSKYPVAYIKRCKAAALRATIRFAKTTIKTANDTVSSKQEKPAAVSVPVKQEGIRPPQKDWTPGQQGAVNRPKKEGSSDDRWNAKTRPKEKRVSSRFDNSLVKDLEAWESA